MPAPDNRKARDGVPGLGGSGSAEVEDWQPPHSETPVAAQDCTTISSFDDLRRLTSDLETIADWRDDLAGRLRRAHLRFELIGLDAGEQEQLEAEVAAFKQTCRALSACFAAPCAERERRAA